MQNNPTKCSDCEAPESECTEPLQLYDRKYWCEWCLKDYKLRIEFNKTMNYLVDYWNRDVVIELNDGRSLWGEFFNIIEDYEDPILEIDCGLHAVEVRWSDVKEISYR